MATAADVVNEALQLMGGDIPPVTGTAPSFDNSTAGKVASKVYVPTVAAVMRQGEFDFARAIVALVLTGNPAPLLYAYEYGYPPNAIQVWQLSPAPADRDPNDPLPINFNVANALVSGTQVRVIQTNQPNAYAIYNNFPNENTWSADFRQGVVRLLASVMAMALGGKPDLAQSLLESASAFEQVAEQRRN